jgi:hypothetical protein
VNPIPFSHDAQDEKGSDDAQDDSDRGREPLESARGAPADCPADNGDDETRPGQLAEGVVEPAEEKQG